MVYYQQLKAAGIEVLFDERKEVMAGEKFADADLIGIPVRLVFSDKTAAQKASNLKSVRAKKLRWCLCKR